MSKKNKASLKEARELFEQNQFTSSIKVCKKILKEENANYGALVLLGAAMQEVETLKSQTLVPLKKAIEIQPDNPVAWRGLVVFYEKQKKEPRDWEELVSAYCKLLKLESAAKFGYFLDKLDNIVIQLKNDQILGKVISDLQELRDSLDEERIKKIDSTLASILTQYPKLPRNHEAFLESILPTIIEVGDVRKKQEFCEEYLRVLYRQQKLSLLLTEAVKMHEFSRQDIYPLEWICRVYAERSISSGYCDGIEIRPYFMELLSLHKESSHALLAKAVHSYQIGSFLISKKILHCVVNFEPKWIHPWVLLGDLNLKLCCWEEAENAAVNVQKLSQDNADYELQQQVNFIFVEALVKSPNNHKWNEAVQKIREFLPESSAKYKVLIARAYVNLNDPRSQEALNKLADYPELQTEAAIIKAIDLRNRHNLEEATDILGSVLETAEACLVLGKIKWEMSDFRHSVIAFLKGIRSDPHNWECFMYLGHYYLEHTNDLERARKCYQKALTINSYSEEAGMGLSKVYGLLENENANIQLLQTLTEQRSGPKWAWLQLGLLLQDRGENVQAIHALRSAIRMDPNDNHSWECLADAYMWRGAHISALKSYQRASELNPESLYSLIQLGNIEVLLGQYTDAEKNFQSVLNYNKKYLPALKGLAETHLCLALENARNQQFGRARENVQEAVNYLTEAVEVGSDFSCVWKLFGDSFYRVSVMPETYCYLTVTPKIADFKTSQDHVIIKKGKIFPLAIRCYCRAVHLFRSSASLWHDLSLCYLAVLRSTSSLCQKTIALKSFEAAKQAIKLSPSSWIHWNLLGVICMTGEIKNYALAQHCFVMAIDKELNNAIAWTNLGSLYLHLGDFYRANEAFSWAQRVDPAYANSWIGQAILAEKLGRKEGMDLFRHATQLGYHSQAAMGYSHWVLSTLLDSDAEKDDLHAYTTQNMHAIIIAADAIQQHIITFPNDSYARNAYGLLLEHQKLYKSAEEQFLICLKCVAKDAEKDAVLINLSRILIVLGKYNEAFKVCQKVKTNTFKSHCQLALALFEAERYEESYSTYEVVLDSFAASGSKRAQVLCAIASIASMFQGENDVKTLLFQCIQIQPPLIHGLLATAALGLLHNDETLTMLVLKELEAYKDKKDCRHHIAVLFSYLFVTQNNIAEAVKVVVKYIHRHPDDERLWTCLAKLLLGTNTVAFPSCAKKGLVLSRKNRGDYVTQIASIKGLSDLICTRGRESIRSASWIVHLFPSKVESWMNLIAALLPWCYSRNSKPSAHWLTVLCSVIRKSSSNTSQTAKWLLQNEERASAIADELAATYNH